MKNIKMIVTDLDNTLLKKDKTISDYTRKVLNKCHENNILIVYATARPERATKTWWSNTSYVIANNGATITQIAQFTQITQAQHRIKTIPIPDTIKDSILARFAAEKAITGICAETGDLLHTNDINHATWGMLATSDPSWNPVYNDFSTPIKDEICKISIECNNMEIIHNILKDYPALRIYTNSGEHWCQITHQLASKYNAIKHLSKHTGIEQGDIIAFGDDNNDIEMLQKCGIGVAVKNAIQDAKDVADYICDTNENDGIARFLASIC